MSAIREFDVDESELTESSAWAWLLEKFQAEIELEHPSILAYLNSKVARSFDAKQNKPVANLFKSETVGHLCRAASNSKFFLTSEHIRKTNSDKEKWWWRSSGIVDNTGACAKDSAQWVRAALRGVESSVK